MDQNDYFERRSWQRRRRGRLVLRERRTGSDRRAGRRATASDRVATFLTLVRERPAALVALLALGNLLSMLDAYLTMTLLPLGFVEANPVMRGLVDTDPLRATVLKMLTILLASVGIWLLRRHRLAVEAAVLLVAVYGVVVLYELAGLLRFG